MRSIIAAAQEQRVNGPSGAAHRGVQLVVEGFVDHVAVAHRPGRALDQFLRAVMLELVGTVGGRETDQFLFVARWPARLRHRSQRWPRRHGGWRLSAPRLVTPYLGAEGFVEPGAVAHHRNKLEP